MSPGSPRRVVLGGLLRGRELEGDAMVTLDAESVLLDTARGRIALALAHLEGIRVPGDVLELYLATGDVIQLEQAPDLNALATEIASSACAIPEMTRSLRALGACDDSERFVRWREWQSVLRHVFRSADESWIVIHPVLSDDRRGPPSFWKRVFWRGKSAKKKGSAKRRKSAKGKA